ncbi:MAG: DUF4391 domain-containing protein, partial [Nitrospira sp.]|nr:DUF4391 domain-containing protein [Nitrospira sp.]
MDARGVIEALGLPAGALVEQRVPKKLLLENGGPTGADKKHISGGIEELFWVAALKPNTIGVPEFSDAEREYLEIAVLRLTVRPEAKAARLIELVHRAIPYPLLLAVEQGTRVTVTAAHKRRAHNEADRTVLDGEVISADWAAGDGAPPPGEFREALALERQPRGSL